MNVNASLARWLLAGEWRMHPVRALVAMGAIALGVALGFAIDLINAAAFNEFTAAVKSVSGVSDLQVRGAQASFDEALFPKLAQREGVTLASPVLEVDATVPEHQGTLKILGVDAVGTGANDLRFGYLFLRHGKWKEAIQHFEAGVAFEDKLRYNEPTDWNPAVRHYLGWALLQARKGKEAVVVYREDLRRYPGNGWALLGLSQSLAAQGKTKDAAEATARFEKSWSRADVTLTSSRL